MDCRSLRLNRTQYLLMWKVSEKNEAPQGLSFGWQRSQLLGAFFNGVLLFALGISIFLQSIERFIALQREFFLICVVSIPIRPNMLQASRIPK